MVAAIDDRDVDRQVGEGLGGVETCKSGSDDYDSRADFRAGLFELGRLCHGALSARFALLLFLIKDAQRRAKVAGTLLTWVPAGALRWAELLRCCSIQL